MHLTAHGEVVAELGPELPLGLTGVRAWPLGRTADREKVRGLIATFADVHDNPIPQLPPHILDIPDIPERAKAIQAWLRASPEAQRHARIWEETQRTLAITDDDGTPIATRAITIGEVPPKHIPVSANMVSDFVASGHGSGPPFYLVTAVVTSHTTP